MKVALGSCFRNSAGFPITRYVRQVARLAGALQAEGHALHMILVWGDSQDGTRDELFNAALALGDVTFDIVERSHGGPVWGSTEEPDRMRALSWVWNGFLDQVAPDHEAALYVESDLLWEAGTMTRLLAQLGPGVDVVAPLVYAGQAFYDIYAFRGVEGERFGPFHPYHGTVRFDGLTEVSSVGSCLAMRGEVARACRIRNGDAVIGFCADVRERGWRVFADARERIEHP